MKKGFSLVEALFVIVVLSLVLGSIFGIAYKAQVSFDEEKRFTETSQHARIATDEITRYIRQAGNEPPIRQPDGTMRQALKNATGGPYPAIQRISAQQIRIRTDITGSFLGPGAATGDPDGELRSAFEDVTIGFSQGSVYLIDHVTAPGTPQILADNIANFGFLFLNNNGAAPANDFDVAAVDVLMDARAPARGANRISSVRYRSHVFVRSKTFDVFATK